MHIFKDTYNVKLFFIDKTADSCKKKSLRPDLERRDDFKVFGVSDAFQNYIAKHLSKILDTYVSLDIVVVL